MTGGLNYYVQKCAVLAWSKYIKTVHPLHIYVNYLTSTWNLSVFYWSIYGGLKAIMYKNVRMIKSRSTKIHHYIQLILARKEEKGCCAGTQMVLWWTLTEGQNVLAFHSYLLWVFSQLYIPSQLPQLMWFATAQYKNMVQYIFVLPLNHCMVTPWARNGMYIRTFQRGSIIIPTWPHPIFLVNMQTFVCRVCHDR